MNFDFFFLLTAIKAAALKIPVTLFIAAASLFLGVVFGVLIALVRFFKVRVWAQVFRWIVTIFRGIPIILIILTIFIITADNYNKIMASLGLNLTFRNFNKGIIAITALSIYASIGFSEAFRGALSSVKKGQYDAAYSIGHTKAQLLWRIIIPQALPVSVPAICSYSIGLVKAVSLATTVTVVDILNGALNTASANYRYLEAYTAAAIIYWCLCIILERIFSLIERHLGGKLREAAA